MMDFRDWGVGAFVAVLAFVCWINAGRSQALHTFGFDIHHMYSPAVRDFLDVDGLPEKGSLEYYTAMAHRDQLVKAHRLAADPTSGGLLTFLGDNQTVRLNSLGLHVDSSSHLMIRNLHYAVVAVGTPPLKFLVALDTGSDLFWLPCECGDCARSFKSSSGKSVELNMYSPSTSSTSSLVACNSTTCSRRRCSLRFNACAYQAVYLSANTSTTGILVDDVLHLGTDSSPQSPVDVPITLGCGIIQTGDFLDGAAVNGLFGLGMGNQSVPSILANRGLVANSFSMCFGPDGLGRIDFGDKGSPDQKVTPLNFQQLHPTYNITVSQIALENNVTDLEFMAVFDSGTSFTYLNDPAYSAIADGFNSQITEPPYKPPSKIIFDNCYALGENQDSYTIPSLNLTMKGGNKFFVNAPTIVIPRQGGLAYCLAIVKSGDVNIIGQNFMSGYRIVFDREKMVLGWKESDCLDSSSRNRSNTLPVNNPNSSKAAPPSVLNPEATPGNRTLVPLASPVVQASPAPIRLLYKVNALVLLIFSVFTHYLIILSC